MSSDDEQDHHHATQPDSSDHEDNIQRSKSPPKQGPSSRAAEIVKSMKQGGSSGSSALHRLVKKAKDESLSTKNRTAPSKSGGTRSSRKLKGKGQDKKPPSGRPADTIFRFGTIMMLHEGTEIDESGIIPQTNLVNDSVPARAQMSKLLQLKLAVQATEESDGFSLSRESTADEFLAFVTSVLPEAMEYFQSLETELNPAFNEARDPEIQRCMAPFVLVGCENRHASIAGEVNYPNGKQVMHYSKSKTNGAWWNNTIILAARHKIPVNVIRGWLPASAKMSGSKRKSTELEQESEVEPEKDEWKAPRRSKRIKVEPQAEENETDNAGIIVIDDSDNDDFNYTPQSGPSTSSQASRHLTQAATPLPDSGPSTSSALPISPIRPNDASKHWKP
ncbi:hypothetical protein C8J56DRAFT_1050205 [Mycena floridula]|nr:hypothetical protein C8J56DRAFT_1050205 [Mycena floridula]